MFQENIFLWTFCSPSLFFCEKLLRGLALPPHLTMSRTKVYIWSARGRVAHGAHKVSQGSSKLATHTLEGHTWLQIKYFLRIRSPAGTAHWGSGSSDILATWPHAELLAAVHRWGYSPFLKPVMLNHADFQGACANPWLCWRMEGDLGTPFSVLAVSPVLTELWTSICSILLWIML